MTTALTPEMFTDSTAPMTENCDRYGAPAKVRVVLTSGSDLVFCGHHDREYAETLATRAKVADVVQL
jgi:hypothetical protein